MHVSLPEMIRQRLSGFSEIDKIVIFGSFAEKGMQAGDIDIAVIQHSDEDYLTLAMRYRKALRDVITRMAMDVLPIKNGTEGAFLKEIEKGKIIYER